MKEKYVHNLPKLQGGRHPVELKIAPHLDSLIEKFSAGDGDDLFAPVQLAVELDNISIQWTRDIWREGRGPEPTFCGRWTMFKRRHVLAWLKFLRKNRAKLKNTVLA